MKKICFNDDWYFYKKDDEKNILQITLPHDAMISEKRTQDSAGGFNTGWFEAYDYIYYKKFNVLKEYQDKKIIFEFEGVYQKAKVYINDKEVYFRPFGYTNFYVDVSDKLNFGQENTIKVIAHNAEQPNSRWYSGAGIYRPVWMFVGDDNHIAINGVKVNTVSINPAKVEIKVKTKGDDTVKAEIFFGDELVVAKTAEADGETTFLFDIENAKLWDCENPNLYKCKITFANDTEEVYFGIRQIELNAKNGFRLNGKRVLLKGCCVHHDNGFLGAVAHPFAEERKVKLLKESGYNSLRSAHNPCSKALLDACDRLGVLMVDELADAWYIHKTKYDYANYFEEWWQQDLSEMIDKDYNHPSVIMYCIGNEVSETSQERGIKLTKEMAEFCRKQDSTRFVTCGVNLFFNYLSSLGFGIYSDKKAEKMAKDANKHNKKIKEQAVGSEFFNKLAGLLGAKFMKFGATLGGSDKKTRDAFAHLDAAGYNYGINRYKKDVIKYPDRVILGSETFCSDAYKFIEIAKENPSLIGDFVWVGIDYLGEVALGAWEYKNYAPRFDRNVGWIAAGTGRLDITGKASGEMAYTRVVYELDKIRIGVIPVDTAKQNHSPASWRFTNAQESWSWNGWNGEQTKVEVYARADYVKLYINNKLVGKKKNKNNCCATFKVKYYDGKIKAVAYDKNHNEIATTSLYTAKNETKLSLLAEKEKVTSEELCYVRLKYTDNDGVVKPLVRGKINVSVTGGKLLGLGNGCPYNEDGYLNNFTDTYYGEALAIIKPNGGENITVFAESAIGNSKITVKVN